MHLLPAVSCSILGLLILILLVDNLILRLLRHLVALLSNVSIRSRSPLYLVFDLHGLLLLLFRHFAHVNLRRVDLIFVSGTLALELVIWLGSVPGKRTVILKTRVDVRTFGVSDQSRLDEVSFARVCRLVVIARGWLRSHDVIRSRNDGFIFLLHHILSRLFLRSLLGLLTVNVVVSATTSWGLRVLST